MTTAARPSFLLDLDGTLVDTVYQHVPAWHQALDEEGLDLAVWRIHRRIGMTGGLDLAGAYRVDEDPADLLIHLDGVGVR